MKIVLLSAGGRVKDINLIYVYYRKGDTWKRHISGGRATHQVPFMQNDSGQELLLGEVFSCPLKAGGAVFRRGYPPTLSKGEGRHSQHQLVLCSAEWEGRFGTVKLAVAQGDAQWHAESQIMLAMACENLEKTNFPSEPFRGGTFYQNAEFKSHYMKRSKRAKLNTSSAKTQCFEWSSQEVRSKLSWLGILPYTES